MRKQQVVNALNASAAGIGAVGLIAPGTLQRVLGAVPTVETNGATRFISSRNLVLSAVAARSDADKLDDLLRLGAAMNIVDACFTVADGLAHKELPRRQIVRLALTTLTFAALELYAVTLE